MKKLCLAVCLVGVLLLGGAQGAFAANTSSSTVIGTARIKWPVIPTGPVKWHPIKPAPRTTTVPEPATLAMVFMGLAGVGALRRKKAV